MVGLEDNDILNDDLLKEIASEIKGVDPEQLSDYLGFEGLQASNAKMLCSAKLKSPYEILLGIFVRENGKGTESAKKLRLIFLEKDMEPCAKVIAKALRNYGIIVSSRADTPSGLPSNPPCPIHHTPELEKTGTVIPSPADTPTSQDVNQPSLPHDKPGSEKPVVPTPSDLQSRDRLAERQQQPTSYSLDMIFKVVFIAIIAILAKFVYDFLRRLLGGE